MTRQRGVDEQIASYFDEGPSELPAERRAAIVAAAEAVSQRRPWDLAPSRAVASLAGAAAAIAVVVLVGLAIIFPSENGSVGNPTETVPARTPSPPPTPPVAGSEHVPVGELDPGTYHLYAGPWTPVTFTFEISADGWLAENAGQTVSKLPNSEDFSTEVAWGVMIVEALFADPCGPNDPLPVGPSVEDFITALQDLPGPVASDPVEITLDGYEGLYVDLTLPSDLDIATCDPPGLGLQIWLDKPGGAYLVTQAHAVTRIHVVDVEGKRFILSASIGINADAGNIAEFEAILESIRFHP